MISTENILNADHPQYQQYIDLCFQTYVLGHLSDRDDYNETVEYIYINSCQFYYDLQLHRYIAVFEEVK